MEKKESSIDFFEYKESEGKRICKYCGIDIDMYVCCTSADLDRLFKLHGNCWMKYRANGEKYPMPGKV
jgi:hypothetical protein